MSINNDSKLTNSRDNDSKGEYKNNRFPTSETFSMNPANSHLVSRILSSGQIDSYIVIGPRTGIVSGKESTIFFCQHVCQS
jgi:hypothetical protein